MTTVLKFYDAAFPPSPEPTGFDGVAFYIGGDTPHVWTKEEVDATTVRYRLPIFVRSDPESANPLSDASAAIAHLSALGAPAGILVALDSETSVDPNYVASFYYAMRNNGDATIDYGSVSSVFGNNIPDGYYWGAHWTNRPHLEPGTDMTQWEAVGAYDESMAVSTLPFWDTRKTEPPPQSAFPTVQRGGYGIWVRRVQGLLVAESHTLAIDGVFGPITEGAVKATQYMANLPESGIVNDPTWSYLLGVTLP